VDKNVSSSSLKIKIRHKISRERGHKEEVCGEIHALLVLEKFVSGFHKDSGQKKPILFLKHDETY
jgi:hypothetical protein